MDETKHEDSILTISEMAKICRVSRQTLIYYDKNNIFKPMYTDKNGYRLYSIYQIPFLREICALKEKNLYLKDIVDNLSNRKIETAMDLLILHQKDLDQQIIALQEKKRCIMERIFYYQQAEKELSHIEQPYIKRLPDRKLLFQSWGCEDMNRSQLHLTHMNLRNLAQDMDIKVDFGWGALLLNESIQQKRPLLGAGGYVLLPGSFDMNQKIPKCCCVSVPAGYFACMNVYAMPYDTSYLDRLYQWIEANHYKVAGDLVNECILDTTFYTPERQTDFCQLQVPVHIPGITDLDEMEENRL